MYPGIVRQDDLDNITINYAVIVIQDPTTGDVMLTKRASHMRKHAGEFCFPGGKRENDETIEIAALRELYEEIGLTISDVDVIHNEILPQAATTYTTGLTFGVVYAHLRISQQQAESRLSLNQDEVELVKWFNPYNFDLQYDYSFNGMKIIVDHNDKAEVVGATADVLYATFLKWIKDASSIDEY